MEKWHLRIRYFQMPASSLKLVFKFLNLQRLYGFNLQKETDYIQLFNKICGKFMPDYTILNVNLFTFCVCKVRKNPLIPFCEITMGFIVYYKDYQ